MKCKDEVRRMKDEIDDSRRFGNQNDWLCAPNHKAIFGFAEDNRGSSSRQATSSKWDIDRSALSRGEATKSNLDFISKIEGALQELDETCYWLELIEKSEIMSARRLDPLRAEAVELTKILVTVVKRAKEKVK